MNLSTSAHEQLLHDFRFFKVYKDGRVNILVPNVKVPPSDDPLTGVRCKDVVISTDPPVSVRIFLPKITDPNRKLPILVYIHGGAFCMFSPASPQYTEHLSTLSSLSGAISVSVEYGLYPDRPIPACYEDSWAAFKWVMAHASGEKHEKWIEEHGDFERVFIAGDSAGGNITHTITARAGLEGIRVKGAILVHPFFGGTVDDEMWVHMYPFGGGGLDDPKLRPRGCDVEAYECERVLVFVAEKDHLRDVGIKYHETLVKSGWEGVSELVINNGDEHCFHLRDPTHPHSSQLIQRIVSFITVQ